MKWTLAFLVGLLTGVIATLINLAIENIAGYKLLGVVSYIQEERSEIDYIVKMRNFSFSTLEGKSASIISCGTVYQSELIVHPYA